MGSLSRSVGKDTLDPHLDTTGVHNSPDLSQGEADQFSDLVIRDAPLKNPPPDGSLGNVQKPSEGFRRDKRHEPGTVHFILPIEHPPIERVFRFHSSTEKRAPIGNLGHFCGQFSLARPYFVRRRPPLSHGLQQVHQLLI